MSKFLCSHNKKSLYVVNKPPIFLRFKGFSLSQRHYSQLNRILKTGVHKLHPEIQVDTKIVHQHFLEPYHSKDGTTHTMRSCTLYTHIVKGNTLVFLFLRSSSVRFLLERCLLQTVPSFCHCTTFSYMIQMYQSRKI